MNKFVKNNAFRPNDHKTNLSAHQSAEAANHIASTIVNTAGGMQKQMAQSEKAVTSSANVVAKLGENSKQIGKATNVSQESADQAQSISATTEQQSASTEEIALSAKALENLILHNKNQEKYLYKTFLLIFISPLYVVSALHLNRSILTRPNALIFAHPLFHIVERFTEVINLSKCH